ncbi:hypothetical protein [Bradyrhizobium sp.]|uniref:hypothetical protein n=1 Tax=Bradyrhizobium sp. TaxID=376 RepID=UPI0025C3D5BB|nr:hypothetical protein [Bradyrhizobium sp.]MCA3256249.1 hypothetical protein [Alphaproteobacteria bacterium]MCA3570684.1 hypothetical protein [Bradyrhizobium sp.]
METPFPAEVFRLTARNLTRDQVLADIATCKAVLGSVGKLAKQMMVPESTLHAVVGGRQAITTGILFGLYSDPPGNTLRVMGLEGRYIARGAVAPGDAETTHDWPPADAGEAADAGEQPVAAEAGAAVDQADAAAPEAAGTVEVVTTVDLGGVSITALPPSAIERQEGRPAFPFGLQRSPGGVVIPGEMTLEAARPWIDPADPLAGARDALFAQRDAIAAQLAAVQPLIAAQARIEAAIAALEVARD